MTMQSWGVVLFWRVVVAVLVWLFGSDFLVLWWDGSVS